MKWPVTIPAILHSNLCSENAICMHMHGCILGSNILPVSLLTRISKLTRIIFTLGSAIDSKIKTIKINEQGFVSTEWLSMALYGKKLQKSFSFSVNCGYKSTV